jgi:histidinol-phosphatase
VTGNAGPGDLDDLAFARLLADTADEITLDLYREGELLVATKPDLTEVPEADHAVEDRLRQLIRIHWPEQGVLGEEQGQTGSQRVRWIIDPIDATRNYIRGIDWWATLLAFQVDGDVEVALVSAPAMGRRWWAVRGHGAFTTGPLDPTPRRLRVSRIADLAGTQLAYGDLRHDRWFTELADRCWRTRGIGDFLMWCLLADGAVDVVVGQAGDRVWDLAAPILLVTEAGGCVTDLAGQPWAEGQAALASNGGLQPIVLGAIAAARAGCAPVRDRGG